MAIIKLAAGTFFMQKHEQLSQGNHCWTTHSIGRVSNEVSFFLEKRQTINLHDDNNSKGTQIAEIYQLFRTTYLSVSA